MPVDFISIAFPTSQVVASLAGTYEIQNDKAIITIQPHSGLIKLNGARKDLTDKCFSFNTYWHQQTEGMGFKPVRAFVRVTESPKENESGLVSYLFSQVLEIIAVSSICSKSVNVVTIQPEEKEYDWKKISEDLSKLSVNQEDKAKLGRMYEYVMPLHYVIEYLQAAFQLKDVEIHLL